MPHCLDRLSRFMGRGCDADQASCVWCSRLARLGRTLTASSGALAPIEGSTNHGVGNRGQAPADRRGARRLGRDVVASQASGHRPGGRPHRQGRPAPASRRLVWAGCRQRRRGCADGCGSYAKDGTRSPQWGPRPSDWDPATSDIVAPRSLACTGLPMPGPTGSSSWSTCRHHLVGGTEPPGPARR